MQTINKQNCATNTFYCTVLFVFTIHTFASFVNIYTIKRLQGQANQTYIGTSRARTNSLTAKRLACNNGIRDVSMPHQAR